MDVAEGSSGEKSTSYEHILRCRKKGHGTLNPLQNEEPNQKVETRPPTSSNASTFSCTNALSGLLKPILCPRATPLLQPSSFLLPSYSSILLLKLGPPYSSRRSGPCKSFLSTSLWTLSFSTLVLKAPESQVIRGLGTDKVVQSVVNRPPTSATPRSSSALISLERIELLP